MCGIAGTIRFRGDLDLDLLTRQRDTMVHRGPDSHGLWCSPDGRVGLAHRRLSIIDLSPGGHQPMIDRARGTAITFNGEIYNYVELRDRLRAAGQAFQSASDTEVILAAYRQWGDACVRELQGMFAFALYDPTRQRVLLARDRAGEKPLFYRHTAEQFSFASEAKALLADPDCPRRVRAASLNEYLAYGYVAGPHTMFADIQRLAPGHTAVIDLVTGQVTHTAYWRLPQPEAPTTPVAEGDLVDELQALLGHAVRQQLVADVPVGVLLSGGVDSSLITALAARASATRIRTFTVRMPGHPAFDEGPYARLVAQHLDTEHIELEAQPADVDLLPRLVAQFDDPIADASMIPTWLVSQEIRRHATVALGGDGGDELFGGYHRYPSQLQQAFLRRLAPAWVRDVAGDWARHMDTGARGRGWLAGLAGDAGTSIANAGRLFRDDERAPLSRALAYLGPTALGAPEYRRATSQAEQRSLVQRATRVDFGTYLVDDVLVKVDRTSMLASLEVRAPFLDPAVTEFAFSRVPDALRATRRARKVLLRRLGARLLPKALDLTRKQGFTLPVNDWMRGPWRPLLDALCTPDATSLVSTDALRRYRAMLEAGRPVGDRLFALLVLRLWEREYRVTDLVT